MSKPPTPADPPLADRLRKAFDPTALPILVAGLVLVGAVIWLLARPLPPGEARPDPVPALEGRIAALEGRPATPAPSPALAEGLARLEGRIAEIEARPVQTAADPALTERLTALEGRIAELAQRPVPEPVAPLLAPLRDQAAALAQQVQALAARPALDPATLATREAVQGLSGRLDQLAGRLDTLAREAAARQAAAEQATAAAAGRLATLEAANQQRTQDLAQAGQRLSALDAAINERTQAANALQQRIAALEGTQQRLAALEGRSARLAALDSLRAQLEAGRPLGETLATLRDPPPALTRFASAAPPTEAALRLSFEDAARAARAASEPAREGQGVLDSAVARLSGLVTVRRGEEVVWGDAASAEIERARRALEAGDLQATLGHLERLNPRAREAMRDWIAQAEALLAARGALRSLSAG